MFVKLNFLSPQSPALFLESLYVLLGNTGTINNIGDFVNRVKGNTGVYGSPTLVSYMPSGSNASTGLDQTNSEIINVPVTPTGSHNIGLPQAYYNSSSTTLTLKFGVQETGVATTYLFQMNATTFIHGNDSTNVFVQGTGVSTSNTTNINIAGSNTLYSSTHTWAPASILSFCYWAYISPTGIVWAASRAISGGMQSNKTGWNLTYGILSAGTQLGPFMSSQYTRLDSWNVDGTILPVCWTNGYTASYKGGYYGLTYGGASGGSGDFRWDTNVNYSSNPKMTTSLTSPINNTTFSVMNTIDATPTTTGTWYTTNTYFNGSAITPGSAINAGVPVTFGTHIRGFQDQAALVRSSSDNNSFDTAILPQVSTKTVVTENAVTRSAWYGKQGASLWDITHQQGAYARWPNGATPIVASYVLEPLIWNRPDYNNIGGLISDKSGTFIFNGDYNASDEFTVSTTIYSIWPLADGWSQRIGLAVPKK